VPLREDPHDVLVSPRAPGLGGLASGAVVGTGSPRRAIQIHRARPDVRVTDLRGNVDTRLERLRRGDYDAVVLAVVGLRRLGIAFEGAVLEFEQMIPAAGQGAMAIEIRADDGELAGLLRPHHHQPTASAVTAERALLRGLGGGCQAPIAAVAEVDGARLVLRGLVAGPEGDPFLVERREGPVGEAERIGAAMAETFLARGAGALVRGTRAPLPEAP